MSLRVIEIPDDERPGAARLAEALSRPWSTLSLVVAGEPTDIPVPPALADLIAQTMRELGEHGRAVLSVEEAGGTPSP